MIIMHVKSAEKAKAIQEIAKQLGEGILQIGSRELNRTLIGLYTGKAITRNVTLPPLYNIPDLLIFAGMSEAKLDRFLEDYGAIGLEPVALKAVSTLHNSNWTVFELIQRLQEERSHMP